MAHESKTLEHLNKTLSENIFPLLDDEQRQSIGQNIVEFNNLAGARTWDKLNELINNIFSAVFEHYVLIFRTVADHTREKAEALFMISGLNQSLQQIKTPLVEYAGTSKDFFVKKKNDNDFVLVSPTNEIVAATAAAPLPPPPPTGSLSRTKSVVIDPKALTGAIDGLKKKPPSTNASAAQTSGNSSVPNFAASAATVKKEGGLRRTGIGSPRQNRRTQIQSSQIDYKAGLKSVPSKDSVVAQPTDPTAGLTEAQLILASFQKGIELASQAGVAQIVAKRGALGDGARSRGASEKRPAESPAGEEHNGDKKRRVTPSVGSGSK